MKKILVFSSSPRKEGNSDTLCDQFIKGATDAGHEAEKIFLWDKDINYCKGCGQCFIEKGSCSQKDDMDEIAQKILAADVLVFASPIYFYTISAKLKTMIDRCCAYFPLVHDKELYYILASADDDASALKRAVECLRGFTVCLDGSEEKGIIYGTGAWNMGDILKTPAMDEAYRMGRNA